MELELFSKLYDRIQFEPSILLFGQNYLSMGGEKDPVWEKLSTEIYSELALPRRKANYPILWQRAVKSDADAQMVIKQIADAGRGVWKNPAVAAVLTLRWSLLYTSSIDDTDVMVTDKGCTFVPQDEKNGKPQYLNKDRRYRVNLCGSRESAPPDLQNKNNQKIFNRKIANKIAWIGNTYLEYYGVLVIDGLDPECDWLNDDNLFEQLIELPPKSVYWFSAPEQLEENALLLAERGILTADPEGFYEHLLRHMPELLKAADSELAEETDDILYASLTLRLSDKQTHTVRIRRSDITDITGDNLCVIDDDILRMDQFSEKSRANRFSVFLTQSGLPSWQLFNTKSKETPYYVPRDKDATLERLVFTALKESGVTRKPVVLCGPSNSGKSMMLAKLALTISGKRKFPVIFIRGEMVYGAESRLEKFIDNWFCDTDRYGGDRPDKIIVIWDGSGLKRTEQDYENLQKLLFNRNVQVVGSAYSATGKNLVTLDQNLSPDEKRQLRTVLSSLGEGYIERFNEISRCRSEVKTLKNSSLLYLLQTLFKYEFDTEYRSLAAILAKQFNEEKAWAEQKASQGLHKYVESFFKAQEVRAQHGVASSFQEKLQLILAQMAVEAGKANDADPSAPGDEQTRKLEKLKELSVRIAEINRVLAVASEFGIQLPLHLLLRFLRDNKGFSYVAYSEETSKIIEILRSDTLIDFNYKSHPRFGEEYYVSFRNSIEAENYICLLCDLPLETHSETRKQKEFEILTQIIQKAESETECWSVIELVRQFGPNGHGMLSELENMRNGNNYLQYKTYWLKIAETIIEQFPNDPEATLVYAHLTRESVTQEDPKRQVFYEDQFNQARTRLETALRKMEDSRQDQTSQYDRLSIELCANYQQALRCKFNDVTYNSIKKRVRTAFLRSKNRDAADFRKDFSSNNMLDILLNAYGEYRKSVPQAHRPVDNNELTEIICDIDDMLNLDDLIYETKGQDLIKKVKGVYEELGSDSKQITQLEQELIHKNSDAFLYLCARMIWQENVSPPADAASNPNAGLISEDRYMILCRDFPYTKVEIPAQLLDQARNDALRVIEFLEDHAEAIKKTKSERCVAMLLRAKWFLKTGSPMLAVKQCVPLTYENWQDINSLCDRYLSYHDASVHEAFIPAYFLKGVYEWIYGDARHAFDFFNTAKDSARYDSQARSIERLVLCAEGSKIPRTFIVGVQRRENRKYTAGIIRETTQELVRTDAVVTRYGMGVSEPVVKYLFDGTMPKEQRQQAKKEGVIRFNLIGPQIGILQTGGDDQ